MPILDWIILLGFMLLLWGIAVRYRKQAGGSLENFFLGGRNLPWYIAGISMVATTFAADTPLAVTELVAQNGLSGNWLWWNALAGGMLTTFFFARLWRRAEVLTEVEFIELRYSGVGARILRGFKAIYLGLFLNVIIIAWVNVALQSILIGFFDISASEALFYTALAMVLATLYTAMSGLLGVAITDSVQFVVAMLGCILLAVLVVQADEIGGMTGLKTQLLAQNEHVLDFFPQIGKTDSHEIFSLPILAFVSFIGVQWWASWYPGAEPGGGGYVAQRMMSARSEKEAMWATLLFQVAHYCIRPWAWIVVALAALVLYDLPEAEQKMGFVYIMRDYLPVGLRGLLLAAFFAAYMSTISTQLNWGASYLTNDLYKRFIRPQSSEKHYVWMARLTTLLLMVVGLVVSTFVERIAGAWTFIFQCGAGLGLVLILRWYWLRINAWAELAATLVPFLLTAFTWNLDWSTSEKYLLTVVGTTLCWLIAMYLTPATASATLQRFSARIDGGKPQHYGYAFLAWGSGVLFTYSILFGTGYLLFSMWVECLIWGILAVLSGFLLRRSMQYI